LRRCHRFRSLREPLFLRSCRLFRPRRCHRFRSLRELLFLRSYRLFRRFRLRRPCLCSRR
jgi:hypothetical protein